MKQGFKIVHRKVYDGPDFYETPEWVTQALLDRIEFSQFITEPACGWGAISKVLEDNGFTVRSQDIVDQCYGHGLVDFLEFNDSCQNIITNPPYKFAEQFVRHGIELVDEKMALFLRLTFLESVRRFPLFMETPLKWVLPFSERVTLHQHGKPPPKNSGTAAYAWFVWDKSYDPDECPMIDWIPPRQ